ncbi:MAG: hypothetical protein ACRDSH_15515, partial [Pseudonocardiaceae bacterium]
MTMRFDDLDHGRVLAAAKEDYDTVIELTRALVHIPTRAGIDPYDPIVELLSNWMRQRGLGTSVLRDDTGAAVASPLRSAATTPARGGTRRLPGQRALRRRNHLDASTHLRGY